MALTLYSSVNRPLTWQEIDDNFRSLLQIGQTASNATTATFGSGITQNIVMVFYAKTAPTKWVTSNINDKMLRVVSSGGGVSGGSTNFSSVFPSAQRTISGSITGSSITAQATTITTLNMPLHTHSFVGVTSTGGSGRFASSGVGPYSYKTSTVSNYTGGDQAHSHTFSTVANPSFTGGGLTFNVAYADVIICTKDAT